MPISSYIQYNVTSKVLKPFLDSKFGKNQYQIEVSDESEKQKQADMLKKALIRGATTWVVTAAAEITEVINSLSHAHCAQLSIVIG